MNTSLFMQAALVPTEPRSIILGAPNTETTLAVDSFKLEEIAKQNQASIDDRKTLHDEIYAIGVTEIAHFNLLGDRMNVNDARVSAIGWVLGVLFTMSQAVVLFFHLDKRRAERIVMQQQLQEATPALASRPRSKRKA